MSTLPERRNTAKRAQPLQFRTVFLPSQKNLNPFRCFLENYGKLSFLRVPWPRTFIAELRFLSVNAYIFSLIKQIIPKLQGAIARHFVSSPEVKCRPRVYFIAYGTAFCALSRPPPLCKDICFVRHRTNLLFLIKLEKRSSWVSSAFWYQPGRRCREGREISVRRELKKNCGKKSYLCKFPHFLTVFHYLWKCSFRLFLLYWHLYLLIRQGYNCIQSRASEIIVWFGNVNLLKEKKNTQ